MTTIDVRTAIAPSALFRMYYAQAQQDMYGGGNPVLVSTRNGVRRIDGGNQPNVVNPGGTVQIPIVLDQSAIANRVDPLTWYPHQYVPSTDDAKEERKKAEYAGFYEQWVLATLSNYK